MTKEDSDYEEKVRNFLEETAQYKRNRKMQELGQQQQPGAEQHDKKKKKKKDKSVFLLCCLNPFYSILG
jgi:hypothetical protein